MQVNDKVFTLAQLKARASCIVTFNNLQQIVVPVFMVNHWVHVYGNLASQLLYFDDGLTSQVSSTALPCVKEAPSLLELYPHHPSLKAEFWHSTQNFKRFGMPGVADTRGLHLISLCFNPACTLRGTEKCFLSGETVTLMWWRELSVSVTCADNE